MGFAGGDDLGAPVRGRPAEHDDVEERVRAEAVRAVDGDAGALPDGEQARHHRFRFPGPRGDHLAVDVGGDPAHVVVHGRKDRDRLLGHVDVREYPCRLRDPGQPLLDDFALEVLEVQVQVVLERADPAPLPDLDGHRAAHHVA